MREETRFYKFEFEQRDNISCPIIDILIVAICSETTCRSLLHRLDLGSCFLRYKPACLQYLYNPPYFSPKGIMTSYVILWRSINLLQKLRVLVWHICYWFLRAAPYDIGPHFSWWSLPNICRYDVMRIIFMRCLPKIKWVSSVPSMRLNDRNTSALLVIDIINMRVHPMLLRISAAGAGISWAM